jgi:GLPGLI family protein
MKHFISVLSISFSLLIPVSLSAQKLSGLATYQSSAAVTIDMGDKVSEAEQERMQNELMKKLQKEYELHFNGNEASWRKVEKLAATPNKSSNSGLGFLMMSSGAQGVLYKNVAEKVYERGEDLMGKAFIIRDSLPQYNWKLTDETKKIGSYNCQKAIHSKVVETKKFSTDMEEMETGIDTVKTEAWFTLDIPVSNGPNNFYGLPGLILEVKTGRQVVICTRVVLNPKSGVEIEKPKKGKIIDSKSYNALSEEKMQEMMKRYSGEGESIQIEIGG